MEKGSRIFIIIVIIVVVAALGVYFVKKKNDKNNTANTNSTTSSSSTPSDVVANLPAIPASPKQTDFIFFYGSTCPHCQKVEQFMTDNNIEKRITIDKKEVFSNQDNANLMTTDENSCKNLADADKGGVPFLYAPAENQCIVGDTPVINYLTQFVSAQ